MMKFPLSVLVLGAFLAGCALDIPQPTPPPPTAKQPYDVSVPEGDSTPDEIWHYDGNDRLLSIDRYERDEFGNAIKQYHSSSLDKLMWYKYREFGRFGSAWKTTQERHFLPSKVEETPGPLAYSTAWAYDPNGNEVLQVDFDHADAVRGYRHLWGETVAAGFRNLQAFGFENSIESSDWYELKRYVNDSSNQVSRSARLGQDRSVQTARQFGYDGENLIDLVEYFSNGTGWSRTTGSFVPSTSTKYRTVWYAASGSAPTNLNVDATPPVAPSVGTPDELSSGIPNTYSDLDPVVAVGAFDPVDYIDFPELSTPVSWDTQAYEYYLPGPHGTITLRFDDVALPDVFLPDSLVKEALGTFGELHIDFDWDLQGRLTRRVASYSGSPQLTIELQRDDEGRVVRIDTSGPMMRVPLTYHLAYANPTSQRPQSISTESRDIDLFTLAFTYDDDTAGAGTFGLGGLRFDSHVQAILVGLGAAETANNFLRLEFLPSVTSGDVTTKIAEVYDVLNKEDAAKILKGQLVWTTDTSDSTTTLEWQTVVPNSNPVVFETPWRYEQAWGQWANLDDEVEIAADGILDETKAQMQAKLAEAMALADSFDFERLFQLVKVVEDRFPSLQSQFERSADNLLKQIKTASGQ